MHALNAEAKQEMQTSQNILLRRNLRLPPVQGNYNYHEMLQSAKGLV